MMTEVNHLIWVDVQEKANMTFTFEEYVVVVFIVSKQIQLTGKNHWI
jgi:hypothetical protein